MIPAKYANAKAMGVAVPIPISIEDAVKHPDWLKYQYVDDWLEGPDGRCTEYTAILTDSEEMTVTYVTGF